MRNSKQYAPVWVMLFSTGAALARVAGERYLLQREWHLSWKDASTAFLGAAAGYAIFRMRHGNQRPGVFTR